MNIVIAEHIVLLAHEDRVMAAATVTAWGTWHISRGYGLTGTWLRHHAATPDRRAYAAMEPRPERRAWQSLRTKAEAVTALHLIRTQLQAAFHARRIT